MEEVEVATAQKGFGVEGQLKDELVHVDVFRTMTESLGGRQDSGPLMGEFFEFLLTLDSEVVEGIVNITVGGWMEGVLEELKEWEVAPELFEEIWRDEKRHTGSALLREVKVTPQLEETFRTLEEWLEVVGGSPRVYLPLTWFGGDQGVGRAGLAFLRGHKRACEKLGFLPGPSTKEMEKRSRASILRGRKGEGFRTKSQLMRERGRKQPLIAGQEFMMEEKRPTFVEARMVKAVGIAMERYPKLNTTRGKGALFYPKKVTVGVRRQDEEGEVTVYVEDPQHYELGRLEKVIGEKVGKEKKRQRNYEVELPEGMEGLLPPPRAACTVTGMEVTRGVGFFPLIEVEGASISVSFGKPAPTAYWNGEAFEPRSTLGVGVLYDYRVGDGRDLGVLLAVLKKELEG